ncbi:unnamed protein product [Amoebophrya sp. A120]|nr:unnamed protein product [Amoebophrya sp. A120]|eukprot:GSA120T00003884001.1
MDWPPDGLEFNTQNYPKYHQVNEYLPNYERDKIRICRCWQSKKFPFCDDTHRQLVEAGDEVGPLVVLYRRRAGMPAGGVPPPSGGSFPAETAAVPAMVSANPFRTGLASRVRAGLLVWRKGGPMPWVLRSGNTTNLPFAFSCFSIVGFGLGWGIAGLCRRSSGGGSAPSSATEAREGKNRRAQFPQHTKEQSQSVGAPGDRSNQAHAGDSPPGPNEAASTTTSCEQGAGATPFSSWSMPSARELSRRYGFSFSRPRTVPSTVSDGTTSDLPLHPAWTTCSSQLLQHPGLGNSSLLPPHEIINGFAAAGVVGQSAGQGNNGGAPVFGSGVDLHGPGEEALDSTPQRDIDTTSTVASEEDLSDDDEHIADSGMNSRSRNYHPGKSHRDERK